MRQRALFLLSLFSFCYFTLGAETEHILRAPVWVYLESVPGTMTQEETEAKLPPIQELDEISRFIMGGMLYGWKFTYTPSDTKRDVAEYFTLEPVKEIPRGDSRFSLSNLKPSYPKISCWAEFTLDDSMIHWTSRWNSVLFKSANGRGRGERSAELAGIKTAYTQAVLQAVREYERKLEKNKPKEIRGEVLLRENARLFADEGWFVADIKVLINIKEVISYQIF